MILIYLAVGFQVAILLGMAYSIQYCRRAKYDVTKLRSQLIDLLGNFLADILDHPRVKLALAQSVANGINHTIEQPDLGQRLQKVSESMREDTLRMSRAIGEQLPGLAASFVGGAMSSITKKKKLISTDTSESSKTQHLLEVRALSLDSSTSSDQNAKKEK